MLKSTWILKISVTFSVKIMQNPKKASARAAHYSSRCCNWHAPEQWWFHSGSFSTFPNWSAPIPAFDSNGYSGSWWRESWPYRFDRCASQSRRSRCASPSQSLSNYNVIWSGLGAPPDPRIREPRPTRPARQSNQVIQPLAKESANHKFSHNPIVSA